MKKQRKKISLQEDEEPAFFDFSHDAVLGDPKSKPFFAPVPAQAKSLPAQNKPIQALKKKPKTSSGNEHVGGDSDKVTFLSNSHGTDVLEPGEGGFSRQMLDSFKDGLGVPDFYADKRLANVLPNFENIDKQTKIISHQKEVAENELDTWFTPIKTVRDHYTFTAESRQKDLETIENDRASQQQKFNAYNAWVPRANGYYSTTLRLDSMMQTLGISNPVAMKTALMQGMKDAREIGLLAQESFDKNAAGSERLPMPPIDNGVNEASKEAIIATQEMNTAYLGFQTTLLSDRKKEINAEGNADRDRLAKIEEVKAMVKGIGKAIDISAAVVQGAPGAISSASDRLNKTGAQFNAWRNKKQVLDGKKQTHNPTYTTVDDDGNMVVRNMQSMTESKFNDDTKKMDSSNIKDDGIELPTSIGETLGTLTDFAYYFEVRDINRRLEEIKNRCDAVDNASELVAIKQKVEAYQVALNKFAQKCNALQKKIAQRRQDYLDFGVTLDRFAQNSKVAKGKGLAPQKGGERYATIMTLTGQIRELTSLGKGVIGSIDSPTDLYNWVNGIIDRRNMMPKINMTQGEGDRLVEMYESVRGFNIDVKQFNHFFADLDAEAGSLFAGLHQGSSSKQEEH